MRKLAEEFKRHISKENIQQVCQQMYEEELTVTSHQAHQTTMRSHLTPIMIAVFKK